MAPTHVLIQLTDPHVPDALILTGDLVDSGSPAAYRRLRTAVDAARIDIPVVYVAGNHDDRAALRTELLDTAPSDEPLDHVTWVGGLRIIALDASPARATESCAPSSSTGCARSWPTRLPQARCWPCTIPRCPRCWR